MLECLNNIVGLSRTDCGCFDTDASGDAKPSDADVSTSGLYLDELESISLQMGDSANPCEKGGLWDLMKLAVSNATNAFETDLLAKIAGITQMKRRPFMGFVGERDFTGVETPLGDHIGWKIVTPNVNGAYLRIKSITTLMDTTATFDVVIYSNLEDAPIHTFSNVESEAQKRKDNDVDDLLLPLFDAKCGEDLIYYILFEPVGFSPLNNNLDCGCDKKNTNYKDFFTVDGVYGDDPTTLPGQEAFTQTAKANGLCIEMDVFCTLDDIICQYTVDSSDVMNRVMALAIQNKAGVMLIDLINASNNINRFTLLNQERLWGRQQKFSKEYRTRIEYLTGELNVTDSECIQCEKQAMRHGTISA